MTLVDHWSTWAFGVPMLAASLVWLALLAWWWRRPPARHREEFFADPANRADYARWVQDFESTSIGFTVADVRRMVAEARQRAGSRPES